MDFTFDYTEELPCRACLHFIHPQHVALGDNCMRNRQGWDAINGFITQWAREDNFLHNLTLMNMTWFRV